MAQQVIKHQPPKLVDPKALKVRIVGGDRAVARMFVSRGHHISTNVQEKPDVYVFTGGPDVCPFLYGEHKLPQTYTDLPRDMAEIRLFKALGPWVPKVGICRGAQFLNVMSGGRMYQDVDGHGLRGRHPVNLYRTKFGVKNTPELYDTVDMTSTHHQMMIPAEEAEIIGLAKEATRKTHAKGSDIRNNDAREWDDAEILYYWNSQSLCFQPHPENTDVPEADPMTDTFFSLMFEHLPLLTKDEKKTLGLIKETN